MHNGHDEKSEWSDIQENFFNRPMKTEDKIVLQHARYVLY